MHLKKRYAGIVFYLEFLFRKSEKIQHNEIRLVSGTADRNSESTDSYWAMEKWGP